MSHAFVDSLKYGDLISGKWDVNTCLRFLLLSETTQKRLKGAPQPPSPCAIKEIVCRRLFFFFSLILTQKNPATTATDSQTSGNNSNPSSSSDNFLTTIVNTLNLQLLIIRRAFPSYHKVILPLQATPSPERMNASIKSMQEQLHEMITWHDTGNHHLHRFFLRGGQSHDPARVDRYFE
jgi:hypothetical protein